MVAAGSIWMPIRLGTLQHVNSEPVWSFQDVHPAGTGYVQTGAYGNGIFMLVGMEMPTLVSTNGRDWTKRIIGEPPVFPNNPTPNYMRLNYFVGNSVAFGNGTFVVPGSNDILVSTNGFWELRSIPIDSGSRYIAYGAGRFVIAGGKNIFASDHVSTPGLSVQRERGSLPKLHVSGEIGRELPARAFARPDHLDRSRSVKVAPAEGRMAVRPELSFIFLSGEPVEMTDQQRRLLQSISR